jgi:hypothetical protein
MGATTTVNRGDLVTQPEPPAAPTDVQREWVIRRALAEEIASAIEARRAQLVQTDDWDDGTDSLNAAAIIAREIGERHV